MKIIKKTLLFFLLLNNTIGLEAGLAENLLVINFATTLDDSIKVKPNGELAGLEIDLIKNLGKKIGHGLEELTLTTNGSQLARYAKDLFDTGVRRINVSLDSLEKKKFKKINQS